MCFGSKKDHLHDEEPPRPAPGQAPQQPTYAPAQKASVPSQYQQQPQYHQQQQQQQQQQQPQLHPLPPAPVELSSSSNNYAPPPGPPPSHGAPMAFSSNDFAPPPGPPPSQLPGGDFAPPPGPPPSHQRGNDFTPPPGPPPSQRQDDLSYIAPPPGSPPSSSENKAKQHDWEIVVPDTSLFPPPPSFFSGFDRSPATNATETQAEAGERWCAEHPLTAPVTLDAASLAALRSHNPRLMQPAGFRGSLTYVSRGVWEGRTDSQAGDTTIIAYPPLYVVTQHSPLSSSTSTALPFPPDPSNPFSSSLTPPAPPSKTIYYEVLVTDPSPRPGEICLALGFTALPYPSFRMPGWHRGSLAVHGDDGHRYVNDRWGGKAFTEPFARGERYGLGMVLANRGGRIETDVFFTRQGVEAGRWNLHEETDAQQDLPVFGLEGYHDLSCAIGTYGAVGFKVFLRPEEWLYKPAGC
ncbi:SPRY domain-containing protein [Madurella fahalii]|uniref:SPRY domain-containing protein n=1 Tax=Madurella fahalii TaxID=1157608 RepID=A0ABQ0FWX2_9PEZI